MVSPYKRISGFSRRLFLQAKGLICCVKRKKMRYSDWLCRSVMYDKIKLIPCNTISHKTQWYVNVYKLTTLCRHVPKINACVDLLNSYTKYLTIYIGTDFLSLSVLFNYRVSRKNTSNVEFLAPAYNIKLLFIHF